MGGRGSKSGFDRQYSWNGPETSTTGDTTFLGKEISKAGIEYNPVGKLEKSLTEQEIIDKVGGYDKTHGSCVSLALAYIGNENGYDVTDLRGGDSCLYFADNSLSGPLNRLARLNGVESYTSIEEDEFKSAKEVLKNVKKGKTYIFSAGEHTAIVRKNEKGTTEYAELQLGKGGFKMPGNGFKSLTPTALKEKFGCQKSHKGISMSRLIEGSSLASKSEFVEALGYINTQIKNEMREV